MDETTQPVAAASSSKKWLYIGLSVFALIIIGFMFTGGGPLGSAYFAGPGVDVDRNIDGTATYSNDEGSVTVGSGASMPSNWPSDAPTAYTGATILYSGSTNPTTGESGSAVAYNTTASLQSVMEYYSARLRAEGWTVEANTQMAGMNVITAKKDTRVFGAYVADAGNGVVNVTAGVQF